MKTEQILLLDCRKEGNKEKLNKCLQKVIKQNKEGTIPIEVLEKTIHDLCLEHHYRLQQIWIHIDNEDKRFMFYTLGVVREEGNERKWLGDITAVTLWETIAKAIIKIYADIKTGGK